MNLKIAILTPTYNHPVEIERLYNSLNAQCNLTFEWVIIDDGSKNDVDHTIHSFIKESRFSIKHFKKQNGGKSDAINYGLDHIDSECFALIVDDDEYLYPNAIDTINSIANKYKDTDCIAIDFIRKSCNNGRPICNYINTYSESFFMTIEEYKRRRLYTDGYTGFYTSKMKNIRFPIYQSEKYMSPSVLQLLAERNGKLLFTLSVIGETKYLADGITKTGRRLRIRSPHNMMYHSKLLQNNMSSIKDRIKYSIAAYAYGYICGDYNCNYVMSIPYTNKFIPFTKISGHILGAIWKKRYGDVKKSTVGKPTSFQE